MADERDTTRPASAFDAATALLQLKTAAEQKLLSPGAVANIRAWLTEPRYANYAPLVAEHLAAGRWKELDDVFWTIIPFGTGGRRGKMYPIGSNAINDRTIGESAQGLADYVKETLGDAPAVVRHRLRHAAPVAALCRAVRRDHGGRRLQGLLSRRLPQHAGAVVHRPPQKCTCGIMVTASHNPPSDNAVKAYWSTGGQLLPPHDQGVIDRVMNCTTINRVPFAEGLAERQDRVCQEEVDAAYIAGGGGAGAGPARGN